MGWKDAGKYLLGKGANLANVPADAWVGSALRGAAGFGVYGGVSEWSQGGSFWEGAKSGAFRGAFTGLGYRATKSLPFDTFNEARTMRDAFGQYPGMSKQVVALLRNKG